MKKCFWLILAWSVGAAAWGQPISRDPYIGAIVLDAATGAVLFEDGADRPGYPASMLKLLNLFVVMDRVEKGYHRLDEMVGVTKEAEAMGGTQVWLDTRERFSLEDMIYAMIVASANDAAMALAIHVAGSRDGFVQMMNEKARELGMSPVSRFQSPHGLPPAKGMRPDITTPRDFAKLSKALLDRHPGVLEYTSTTDRMFRGDPRPFQLQTSNRLLRRLDNCDGLKTGYFKDAGFSIAATAHRDDRRVIVVVMGAKERKVRDDKVVELFNRYLPEATRKSSLAPPLPPPPPEPETAVDADADEDAADDGDATPRTGGGWKKALGWGVAILVVAAVAMGVRRRMLLAR